MNYQAKVKFKLPENNSIKFQDLQKGDLFILEKCIYGKSIFMKIERTDTKNQDFNAVWVHMVGASKLYNFTGTLCEINPYAEVIPFDGTIVEN